MRTWKPWPHQLNLGEDYVVRKWGKTHRCRLIKVTEKGYNLLDLETNTCIMKPHLYPSKYPTHQSKTWFWIQRDILIERLNDAWKKKFA